MRIEVQKPEAIYSGVASALETTGFLPPTLKLGELNPAQGLFSNVYVDIEIFYPKPLGYSLTLETSYFDRDQHLWKQRDAEKLLDLMGRTSTLVHNLQTHDNGMLSLDSMDVSKSNRFLSILGWNNEGSVWLAQTKIFNEKLRKEEVTDPRQKQIWEEGLSYLINNPTSLPGTETVYIHQISPDAKMNKEEDFVLRLDNQADVFTDRLVQFATHSQAVLNAILAVRGVEQDDTLVLRIDETNYLELAIQNKS